MPWYVPRGGPGSTARRKNTTHMSKKRCLRLTQRTQGALLKPCQAMNEQCRSPQCQSHSTSRAHDAGSLTPHSTTLVALRVLQVPNPTCKVPSQNKDARQLKLDLKTRKWEKGSREILSDKSAKEYCLLEWRNFSATKTSLASYMTQTTQVFCGEEVQLT